MDTVLARLYIELGKRRELLAFLLQPNYVALSEVEPVLKDAGQFHELSLLYLQREEDDKLLDLWSRYFLASLYPSGT